MEWVVARTIEKRLGWKNFLSEKVIGQFLAMVFWSSQRGGENIARQTKRRERDVRKKRRAEDWDFVIYKLKATARAMLKTSQNKAAMKVISSAAA